MNNQEQRERLVELLNHNVCPLNEFTGCEGCGYMEVEDCRASAMADYLIAHGVTFREKGYWLTWEEKFPGTNVDSAKRLGVFCSVCEMHADNRSDFCPNCGEDMRGSNDEQRT